MVEWSMIDRLMGGSWFGGKWLEMDPLVLLITGAEAIMVMNMHQWRWIQIDVSPAGSNNDD